MAVAPGHEADIAGAVPVINPKAGWLHGYVGLPFLDGGRKRTDGGLDCWGLVRLIYAEQAGIELPSYGEISAADLAGVAGAIAADCFADPWSRVDIAEARILDVVVVKDWVRVDGRPQRRPAHVGVMIDAGRLLHVRIASAAVIIPLTAADIRFRIHGLFRHRSLA
jgi:cell wall-associated NlpC family hydrolase